MIKILNANKIQLLNLTLRALTLSTKFLLVFILAKWLKPSELGTYGLIIATVAYGMYPLGFDFHNFNIREILTVETKARGRLLSNQVALHLRLYSIFLPMFLLVFVFKLLPWNLIIYFFVLLIFEHVNQEVNRLLIALSKQLAASFCLFIRQGLWVLIVLIFMYFFKEERNLNTVLFFWTIGSGLAVILGLFVVKNMGIYEKGHRTDWKWILKGLKISAPLLIASLSLNAISTLDRYWFSWIQGNETLAAYVFFLALCSSLLSFLDAAIFSFSYPKLISAVFARSKHEFEYQFKKMLRQTIGLISVFTLCSLLMIKYILSWIHNSIYSDNLIIFYVVLISIGMHCLSYVYHYALYALRKDKIIVSGHALTLVIFITSGVLLMHWDRVMAIPLAVLISYFYLLLWKFFFYNFYIKKLISNGTEHIS